jgi:hypothetical protein
MCKADAPSWSRQLEGWGSDYTISYIAVAIRAQRAVRLPL